MPHRTFVDRSGQKWEVWSVTPTKVERRERQVPLENMDDRRKESEYRVVLGTGMAKGWLCFDSGTEKRRLTPYPDRWDHLDESSLCSLLAAAKLVRRYSAPDDTTADESERR